jgi:hypothetical protein
MIRKILCFIGWHEWVWSLIASGMGEYSKPPNDAKCCHCGEIYGVRVDV